MGDPLEVLLSSPRSLEAISRLGFEKDDLKYLTKEELKLKLGNIKTNKQELIRKWEDYEESRKAKI